MNAFLLSLGIALLLTLSAAFAAPFFIDWSNHRHYFEAQVTEILGRPVELAGPLEVRLVPFPRLTADDVRIGAAHGEPEGVERVRVRAALTPLLSGEFEISEIVLTRPRITLTVDDEGRLGWAAGRDQHILPLPTDRTRLERFEVVDGTFILDDPGGGERFDVTGVNATGSAGTLTGPFRLEGSGLVDGKRYSMRLGTGRLNENGSMRFTASVTPADRPLAVDLDGRLEIGSDTGTRFLGAATIAQSEANGTPPWRVQGEIVATPRQVSSEQLALTIGDETERFSLEGRAELELAGQPHFEVSLQSRQLDFDRVYGGGIDDPVSPRTALTRLEELLSATSGLGAGQLTLEVGSIVLSGNLLENVTAELGLGEHGWQIKQAQAEGPGFTQARFSGSPNGGEASDTLSGRLSIHSRQASSLVTWLFEDRERFPELSGISGELSAEAFLDIDPQGVYLSELAFESGATRVSGELAYSGSPDSARPDLVARLETERVPREAMTRLGANRMTDLLAIIGRANLDIAIEAGTVETPAADLNDVTVVVAASDGTLRIDRLRVGDAGGARIDGHGHLTDFANGPVGQLDLEIDAEALDTVADLLAAAGFDAASGVLSARAEVLVPVNATVSLALSSADDQGQRIAASLAGTAGDTDLAGNFSFRGPVDRPDEADIEGSLEAGNADGSRLLAQIEPSWHADADGAGRLTLDIQGRLDNALAFALDGSGPGIEWQSAGDIRLFERGGAQVDGMLDLATRHPSSLLASVGIELPDVALSNLDLSGRLSAADGIWRLSEATLRAGPTKAQGSFTLDLAAGAPTLDGALALDRLDLPGLIELVQGQAPTAEGNQPLDGTIWSAAAFTPIDVAGLRAQLRLTTPRLNLGGAVSARNASLDLTLTPGRYAIERLEGSLFGGRIGGDLELAELDGSMQMESRVEISDVRLEDFGWRRNGRAVAAGSLSASAELAANGRSMSALVASLSGSGSVVVENGVIRHMNPHAFAYAVDAADKGPELDEDAVHEAFARRLDAGSMRFGRAEGSLTLAGGVARTRNVRLDGAPIDALATATVDLSTLDLVSEWTLRAEATGAQGRMQEVSMLFAGPLAAPSRTIDVAPLIDYLTTRAIEREVERLEELEEQRRLRNERQREVRRFEAEQRRFEAEREERLRRIDDVPDAEPGDVAAEEDGETPAVEVIDPGAIVEAPPPAAEAAPPAAEAAPPAAEAEPVPAEPTPRDLEQLIRDALSEERPPAAAPSPVQGPPPAAQQPARGPMNIVPPFAGAGRPQPSPQQ